jgi:UDP-3-O-[3-hydroxymyristoyl] glucosamine N-acyltransferase
MVNAHRPKERIRMAVTVRDLVDHLRETCEVTILVPDRLPDAIVGPAAVDRATAAHVTFVRGSDPRALERIRETAAGIVIAHSDVRHAGSGQHDARAAVIAYSPNPRLEIIRVAERFFSAQPPASVHPTAVVSAEAILGPDVSIGPGATVGRAEIGRGTRIGAGVRVLDDVSLGEECVVFPGAVIGADGFGYERDDSGTPHKFPHVAGVRIGDRVEIGANTCIDRGALTDTVIEDDVKIDNLVHVAHNVVLGARTMIAASAVVAGSARVGSDVWIGPLACISDGITVGDGASVSLGAVVTRDVEPGQRVTGNFAIPHERFLENLRKNR